MPATDPNDEVFRIRACRTATLEDDATVAIVQMSEQLDGSGRLFSFYVTPEILEMMAENFSAKAAGMRKELKRSAN